jgi:hypothetical protein
MPDRRHIANALQCHSTRSHLEAVKNISVKAFYLTLIVGAVYVSTKPNTSTNAIRFISACQSLTKRRHIDHPVREQSVRSACVKHEMPPEMLAGAG